jgi:hypothetical protein
VDERLMLERSVWEGVNLNNVGQEWEEDEVGGTCGTNGGEEKHVLVNR